MEKGLPLASDHILANWLLGQRLVSVPKLYKLFPAGASAHPQMVPYDLLTDKEKRKDRERCQELLKYLQFQGYKLAR